MTEDEVRARGKSYPFLVRGTIFWLFVALASIPAGAWWLWETWRRPDA